MMSSTPVLTSRLAGIPKDHYPHLYFLDEITPECIYNSIDRIFAMSDLDRYNFGQKARMFITENKTEKVQAEKLFSFFNNFNC